MNKSPASFTGARFGVALALVAGCGLANAQQAGAYIGTTADGHSVEVDVQFDSANGVYYVSYVGAGFALNCAKSGTSQEWGLGLLGYLSTITGDSADVSYRSANFYLAGPLTFKSNNTVTGKIRGSLPLFIGTDTPPKGSETCASANLKFTATLTSSASPKAAVSSESKGQAPLTSAQPLAR